MSTLQLLNHLHHLQSTLTAVWMGFSELFTAAAMLWCLNTLARAIRIVYVAGFFVATIADTSLVWLISAVTVALMTLPNLIGIFLMRREVKELTDGYWRRLKAGELDN